MGLSAQNTLLKTLEEPSKYAVIILIASTINFFLPTILSRTRNIIFNRLTKQELESILHQNLTSDMVKVAEGSVKKIQHILSEENKEQYILLNDIRESIKKKDKINVIIKLTEIDFKKHDIEYLQQLLLKDNNYKGVLLIEKAKNKINKNANENIIKTALAIELCN